MPFMTDELAEHLDAIERDDCYRVDAVMKQSPLETTERVFFQGINGAKFGPLVRKRINQESGLGAAYERMFAMQRSGKRFLYLPHIVDCHDSGGTLVVIMEYVEGETLADVVYRCDPSLELASDVFPRLCDAVGELHEGFDPPIIHRDLKPSNVMLSRNSLTIIDLGIARTFKEGSEEDTHRFGTRTYAPPEQFGFGQTDVRSDVYTLGMLLYFCLTEKMPDAKTRKGNFADARISEPLRQVISRATAFSPSERYATAAELKRAFLIAANATNPALPLPQSACVAPYTPPPMQIAHLANTQPFSPVVSRERESAASVVPHSGIMQAGTVKGSRLPRTIFGRTLAKIPFALGVAWDIVLAILFAICCIGALRDIIDPSASSAAMSALPLFPRIVSYGSLALLIIGPVLFALSDRRPLARMFPKLASFPVERDMAACFVIMLVGFTLFFIAEYLPPS